jgi:hypothetical protein
MMSRLKLVELGVRDVVVQLVKGVNLKVQVCRKTTLSLGTV